MSDKRRVAERNRALMINPSDTGGALMVSTNGLFVGPGEPGPGDEWHFPPQPIVGTSGETVPPDDAAGSNEDGPRLQKR